MTQAGTLVARLARKIIFHPSAGVNQELVEYAAATRSEPEYLSGDRTGTTRAGVELLEKCGRAQYPSVYVYCERVHNTLREKFRTFSGTVEIAIDVRVSADEAEEIEGLAQTYTDAVVRVLHRTRGRWAEGVYYPGAYDVDCGAVKRGGRQYVQANVIRFAVQVNY